MGLEKNRKKKTNFDNIMYVVAFSIYGIVSLLGASALIVLDERVKDIAYIVSILLFSIVMLHKKYEKVEYVIYGILCVFTLYTSIRIHKMLFFINLLAIVASKEIELKRVVKVDIVIKTIILLIHCTIYIYQYIFNYAIIEDTIIMDLGRNRHALYFNHPNLVAQIVLWLAFDILYLKQCDKKSIILTFILLLITYMVTDSRTMFLMYIVFLMLYYGKNLFNEKNYKKIIDFIQKFSIDILAIFSLILALLSDKGLYIVGLINKLTSGRVYYSVIALDKFGINLFPNVSAINIEDYTLVDNFYIRAMVLFGIIFIILMSIMTKLIGKDENMILKIIIIVFAINLFSEYNSISIGNAIPLLLMGNIIINGTIAKDIIKLKDKFIKKEKCD